MICKRMLCLLLFLTASISLYAQDKPFSDMDVFELEWAEDPQISPDGGQIVYRRRGMDKMTDRRTSRLWLINTDGTGHLKLTDQEENESSARWLPDGSRIAFASSAGDNGSKI